MQGNPEVIDFLNRALRHELTAVNQYWLHYRLLDDWGYTKLAAKQREEPRTGPRPAGARRPEG
jgi:bacterioferritin